MDSSEGTPGFRARLGAALVDAVIVYLAVHLIVLAGLWTSTYIPFELTFLILLPLYVAAITAWQGRTPGKWLLGIAVRGPEGGPLGPARALLRELVGKLLVPIAPVCCISWLLAYHVMSPSDPPSAFVALTLFLTLLALLGLLIHYFVTRRTWYDAIARTSVVSAPEAAARSRFVLIGLYVLIGLAVGYTAFRAVSIGSLYSDLSAYGRAETDYGNRDPALLTEASSISPDEDSLYTGWLDEHGVSPVDYAVEMASRHQVTIFGESHFNGTHLRYLHEMIPALYHRAGVRCIAMECCAHEDNEAINELVTAPGFDWGRAIDVGRHQAWRSWGAREYWEVFEVVWRLNHSLPPGSDPMRVVGIDSRWDGPSFALSAAGDDRASGPWWERLRALRILPDVANLAMRDELMAGQIEREIIEKGVKGIVWVGAYHSFIGYKQPYQRQGRMAYILHSKCGESVFQIYLHGGSLGAQRINHEYAGPPPAMERFLERVAEERPDSAVGFTVIGSPFALLRDSCSYLYHVDPSVGFGDVASGYVYLGPNAAAASCTWVDGFITQRMFLENRPFYEARIGEGLRDADEVNERIAAELAGEG